MDRRKLRRLLASSSFAALLVAAQQVRGQTLPSLTNPAGNVTGFLRVTAADLFQDVHNFGTLTGGASEIGIDVEGGGTVTGDVFNLGLINIDDSEQGTGILMEGSGGLVGDHIVNKGLIDIDVVGNGTGLIARGIAVEGTNNVVGGLGNTGTALNNTETIDIFLRATDTAVGAKATAKADGKATGMFVGTDVTLGGGVANDGLINVEVSNFARASADATGKATADAKVKGTAFGVRLTPDTLTGGFVNHNDGSIVVDVFGKATADSTITTKGTAKAIAKAEGKAIGLEIDSATITGVVANDGSVDVDILQTAFASALALSPAADAKAIASADAKAKGSGMHIDATRLVAITGGQALDQDGTILLDATARGSAIAKADALGAAKATADAKAKATAKGLHFDVNTVFGEFENEGVIDVRAFAVVHATAEADTDNKSADVKAQAHDGKAWARGVSAGGDTLTGNIENLGEVFVDATVSAFVNADAAGTGTKAVANAKATIQNISGKATGIAFEYDTIFGSVLNQGIVAVNASAIVAADVDANSPGEKADAQLKAVDVDVLAIGANFEGTSINGSFNNSASIEASAWIGGKRTIFGAIATGLTVNATGDKASVKLSVTNYTASATGLGVDVDTITGDLSNNGNVNAWATANLRANAVASAQTNEAKASFKASDIEADATGIEFEGSTVTGKIQNNGNVGAHALVLFNAHASASSTGGKANATANATNVEASAIGLQLGYDTVFGGIANSGNVTATAKLDGSGSLRADADADESGDKANAKAIWDDAEAFAVAYSIDADSISNGVVNDGSLQAVASGLLGVHAFAAANTKATATAKLLNVDVSATGYDLDVDTISGTSLNNGQVQAHALAQLFVNADALSENSKAKAVAQVTTAVNVEAYGLDHHVDTVFGNVINNGDITVSGRLDASGVTALGPTHGVVAHAKGVGSAKATAAFTDASISITGFHAPFDTITGNLENHGAVYAEGTANVLVSAKATATSKATAKAVFKDLDITVLGVNFSGTSLGGDLINQGYVHVTAAANIVVNAFASSTNGSKAGAKATITDISISAVALTFDVDTVDGSVLNTAQVTAKAILNGGDTLKVVASGTDAKAEAKWTDVDLSATAADWDFDTVDGNITNQGALHALAKGAVGVTATANGTAKADAKAAAQDIDFDVRGLHLDIDDTLFGSFVNEARVQATAIITLDVHANAIATTGKAGAKASATDVDIDLIAMELEVDQDAILGSVSNNGNLTAIAQLNSGSSIKAFASGTDAKAEAKFTDIDLTATGLELDTDTIGGSFLNAGAVWAQVTGNINVVATALGTAKADAKAVLTSVSANANGLLIDIETLDGDFTNSGDITARVELNLEAHAKAVATTGKAGAKASIASVSINTAAGINVTGTSFGGDVLNTGNINAIALINSGSSVKAVATGDEAKATANFLDIGMSATAYYLQVDTIDGDAINSGTLYALAKGDFNAVATADGEAGKAEAKAAVTSISVNAYGMYATPDTIGGSLRNSAAIYAVATAVIGAHAKATSPTDEAKAKASGTSISASAIGFYLDTDTIGGSLTNTGYILASAKVVAAPSSIKATASGDSAKADAKFEDVSASATGMFISAGTIFGDIINSGDVAALASVNALVSAKAVADVSKAEANAKAHDLTATAIGISLTISQLGSGLTTFGGDLRNSGNLSVNGIVVATVHGSANAAAGTDAKAKATGDGLNATAYGILVPYNSATIFGAITNSAQILVKAQVDALVSADAVAKSSAKAEAKAKGEAEAHGIRLEDGDTLGGGLHNSGYVQVQGIVDVTALATAAGTADNAKADADAKAKVAGMTIDGWDTVSGGFINSGTLLVTADVFAKAVAVAGDTEEAKAKAKAEAVGMLMEKGLTLSGDMLNAGTIMVHATAVAFASGSDKAEAKAEAKAAGMKLGVDTLFGDQSNDGLLVVVAKATVTGSKADAKAEAIGMQADVKDFASGSMINAGTVLVSALANDDAKATGMKIAGDGFWSGAMQNTTSAHLRVFASDPTKATARGMVIDGKATVAGGIINAGTVLAEAVSVGSANAVGIDLSKAKGTGHLIQMIDGQVEAITRTTAFAAPGTGGTAVLMKGNANSDQLDWSGGLILADIIGDQGSDNLDVFAGRLSKLNFSDTIDGLQAIDVNNATHAATAVQFRINGFVTNVSFLNVNENGTLVVGRIANINVNTANFDGDGRVFFEIEPGNSNNGVIHANTANLNGTIGINPLAGLYFDTQTYLVIDANLNGAFTNQVTHTPLLSLSVEQNSPDVVLTVTRNAFASVAGLTHNQNELGEAIDDFYDPVALLGTEIGDVIGELFTLNTDELLDAYNDLHGAEYAQMAYAAFESMQFMQGGVSQRLHDARSTSSGAGQSASLGPQSLQYAAINADEGIQGTQLASIGNDPDHPGSVWGKGYGSWGSLDGDEEAPGYDRTTGAIIVGLDYHFDEQFLVGIAGAYSFSNLDFDDGDNGDVDSFQIGLFGSWDSGTWYVDGLVSYAFQSYETERHINFGTIDSKANADYDGGAVQIYGEVGYQFQVSEQALVTPLLGLGWTSVWTDSFKEKGAGGANLRVDEASYDSLATTLGVRGSLNLDGWEPSLFLGWRHEFLDDHGEADIAFSAVPDSEWTVIGSDVGSDAGLVGVGVVAEISAQFEAVADYSGQFSGSGNNHTGSIGIRFKF